MSLSPESGFKIKIFPHLVYVERKQNLRIQKYAQAMCDVRGTLKDQNFRVSLICIPMTQFNMLWGLIFLLPLDKIQWRAIVFLQSL